MSKAKAVMDKNLENYDWRKDDDNTKSPVKETKRSNKCSQCNFASARAGNLRQHLKTHSGDKSNKCNQCDYASSRAGDLRIHLRTHNGDQVKQMSILKIGI